MLPSTTAFGVDIFVLFVSPGGLAGFLYSIPLFYFFFWHERLPATEVSRGIREAMVGTGFLGLVHTIFLTLMDMRKYRGEGDEELFTELLVFYFVA